MGNLCSYSYHGYEFDDTFSQAITMQWHITVACDQRCKHCYMFNNAEYTLQKETQLTRKLSFELIDGFVDLLRKLKTAGYITITGGDPLLSNNFWDILGYALKYKDILRADTVLGNSYHVDKAVAQRLKLSGVKRYQISIDGLESTHDYIRKVGSFKDAIRALECLHNEGIQTMVMATVHKQNCNEIVDLYKYLSNLEFIDSFSLDRMTPIGHGKTELNGGIVDNDDYRKMMYDLFTFEAIENRRRILAYKDRLWKPLFYHLGLTDPLDSDNKRYWAICPAGASFCVLSDGSIYACRRLDIKAGKFPEENFEDIYFNAPLFRDLRNPNQYTSCNDCFLKLYCNGCPAMKYAVNGQIGGTDPNCPWHFSQSQSFCK